MSAPIASRSRLDEPKPTIRTDGAERRYEQVGGGRGAVAHSRHARRAVLCIGHDLPACQPSEDDVVHRARSEIPVEGRNRRFRTKWGRPPSRACRGIVGLGLLAGGGGANQE
jgi:hypothetical protein